MATRVRFDRVNPAPFSIDIGTSENLALNANGGDDTFSATGNLAALIKITVDGGTGNDTINGSNGIDILLGGDGNDFVDGNQGNDVAFIGAGDDTFRWDPGDGSDTVEGQDGDDTMLFNGGQRVREHRGFGQRRAGAVTRNVANIVMDSNDVETIDSMPSAAPTCSPSTTSAGPTSPGSAATSPRPAAAMTRRRTTSWSTPPTAPTWSC